MSKKNKHNNEDDTQIIYIEQEKESIPVFTSLSLTALVVFGLWIFIPDFKTLINPLIKSINIPFKSFKFLVPNNKNNETINWQEKQTEKKQNKEETKGKSISTNLLFINNVSVGSRFIGMAEGNYILTKSGTYSNTSNYNGHIEPSKAVPNNTINRGFCSTPIQTNSTSETERINIANLKCLKRLQSLVKEVNKGLNWNTTKLSEPRLSLFLNTIDLGNQARGEVKRNMYTYQIPRALEQDESITLATITAMRRDSFYSSKKNKLTSALNTIPALRRSAIQYCGNDLLSNVISTDQARRVIAANQSLNNIGMGLTPMTRKQIMEKVCIRKK
jgi:hypothetical protein